jgi:hypothetical protein
MNKNHAGADLSAQSSMARTGSGEDEMRSQAPPGGRASAPAWFVGRGTFADNIRSLSLWQHGACFKNQN